MQMRIEGYLGLPDMDDWLYCVVYIATYIAADELWASSWLCIYPLEAQQ